MRKGAVITKERWDELSDKDQALLKQIGVAVKDAPKKKTLGSKNPLTLARKLALRNTAPKEYYLHVISVCECCDGISHTFGQMKLPEERARHLEFVECSMDEFPKGEGEHKTKKLFPVNCPKCKERLMLKSKEMLVEQVMKLTTVAVTKGWL